MTWSFVIKKCFPGEHAKKMRECYDTRSDELLHKVPTRRLDMWAAIKWRSRLSLWCVVFGMRSTLSSVRRSTSSGSHTYVLPPSMLNLE